VRISVSRNARALILIALGFLLFLPETKASETLFYKEANLIGGYSEKDGWSDSIPYMPSSLGFEYYRKFSNEYGDYMTADLQFRVAYDSLKDINEAWGVEFHNAWLEYKLMPMLKARAGHFKVPFGLEPLLDTHGTILQTLAEQDIGFKHDWGGALRGYISRIDYEMSLQLGSGMSLRMGDGNYLVSARAGLSQDENPQAGLSLLYGEILRSAGMSTLPRNKLLSNDPVRKKRIGLDGMYLYGPLLFKAEAAFGQNNDKYVFGYLGEADYTFPHHQDLEFELQFKSWINDLETRKSDETMLTAGFSYKVTQSVTLRGAYMRVFNIMNDGTDNRVVFQFYYYG
jgi:hypothetical protein